MAKELTVIKATNTENLFEYEIYDRDLKRNVPRTITFDKKAAENNVVVASFVDIQKGYLFAWREKKE